jgi:hypothetical protein
MINIINIIFDDLVIRKTSVMNLRNSGKGLSLGDRGWIDGKRSISSRINRGLLVWHYSEKDNLSSAETPEKW